MVYGTAREVGWWGSKKSYVLQKGLNSNIFTYLDTGVQKTTKQKQIPDLYSGLQNSR